MQGHCAGALGAGVRRVRRWAGRGRVWRLCHLAVRPAPGHDGGRIPGAGILTAGKSSANYRGGVWAGEKAIRLNWARARARRAYPAGWLRRVEARAQRAAAESSDAEQLDPHSRSWRWPDAVRAGYEAFAAKYAGAIFADMSDADIREAAAVTAGEVSAMLLELPGAGGWSDPAALDAETLALCAALCRSRHAVLPGPVQGVTDASEAQRVRSVVARMTCPVWWRRQLRRHVARMSEGGALELGIVSKRNGQPYASDRAVLRRREQNARNRAMLENTYAVNESGDEFTLAELSDKGTANRAIRRGELMTRIRGCEELADVAGHPGVFLTLTCPSRFHSTIYTGRPNPKYTGLSPRDGQLWLRKMWARARAEMGRAGVAFYGFRVAEPHHDGCPHWHALAWAQSPDALVQLVAILEKHWLSEDGSEPGALEFRVNAKPMHKGGAAGYVAKYIAKNIDDYAVGSHTDDYLAPGEVIAPGVVAGVEVLPCHRVEAWAAHWGIRQFQAFGQPPVTVWRELRRIKADAAGAHPSQDLRAAWQAAQRHGDALADWAGYVAAQGGTCTGRNHGLHLARRAEERAGQYETVEALRPVGVEDRRTCAGVWCVSDRRVWRVCGRGDLEVLREERASELKRKGEALSTRTRLNNCTRGGTGQGVAPCREWAGLLDSGPALDGDALDAARWWHALQARGVRAGPAWVPGGSGRDC